jgi:hypothetical protein
MLRPARGGATVEPMTPLGPSPTGAESPSCELHCVSGDVIAEDVQTVFVSQLARAAACWAVLGAPASIIAEKVISPNPASAGLLIMRGTQCLRLRPLRGGCWSVAAGVQALEPLACSSSGRGMVQEACSGQQQPCTSGSGGQVPAAAAAAARGWGRHLPQRRHFVTVPTARGSATEDFDLIAPDMGLVRIEG